MPTFPVLLALFFIVPLVEIFILIQMGGWIGVWPTVALVIFTAVLGAYLLRLQGFATLRRFQQSLDRGELPATQLVEGFFLLLGGALLLTPGFFTDAIGFACLIPTTRVLMAQAVIKRGLIQAHSRSSASEHDGAGPASGAGDRRTIEGEWEREPDPPGKDKTP